MAMQLNDAQTQIITEAWSSMNSKFELLTLLNAVGPLIYGKSFKPFAIRQLNFYANPKWVEQRYTSFTIKKKSGKERAIHAPHQGLKFILSCLNLVLQAAYPVHHRAFGFIPGMSIRDNAALHVGHPFVYNIDLSDFFHSFGLQRVKMGLLIGDRGLGKEKEKLAFFIACLCTHPFMIDGIEKAVLPQGAPTSPTLTNIICHRLDKRLHGLAKRFNLTYSRYADDISFSGSKPSYEHIDFQTELQRLLSLEDLRINEKKTRAQGRHYRQEVTGLTVNEKVNVSRMFSQNLRSYLYLWKRYGYEKAAKHFDGDFRRVAPHRKSYPEMEPVLEGRLNFMRMVKGKEDSTYIRLRTQFDGLRRSEPTPKEDLDALEAVVNALTMVGLEEGLNLLDELDL